ncbi:MAG: hypothetical protein HUJ52_00930, partial [Malacoplasma sp.]|nr:hypothetical protein [Malacoplasma sp.]
GTGWLFYHETDPNKKQSEYTYYLLTNNHVTNQFIFGKNCYVQTIKDTKWSPTEEYLSFAYQNWDDAKGDTKTIDFMSEAKFEGKSNEYNLLDYAWTNDSEKDNFSTLLSTYMNFTFNYDFDIDGIRNEEESYSKSRHYYPDMTFCKVDFGKYAGTELATRLDKLNEYADKHNNRLVEFDDYANTGTNKTLFVGGYPLTYLDQKMGTIYENGTKFQKYLFTNVDEIPTNNIDASLMSIDDHYDKHGLRDPGDNEIDDGIYDEKDEHDKTYSYNYCPYIEPQYTNEMTLKLGAGASGSLAMTAFDPLNPDTYKATGIYWGVLPGYFPLRYAPRFAPFSYNFGKNLPTEIENNGNLVKTFFDSDAFKKWKRTNKLLYDCQWHKSFGKRSARIVSFATTEGGKIIVNWPDAQIKISKFEDKETVFEKGPFTIDKDRSLTVDDLLNGQKVTITVIPDEHYKFATWKTNNNENPVNLECVIDEKGQCVYTFTLGEDNVGLTAVFEEKEEE